MVFEYNISLYLTEIYRRVFYNKNMEIKALYISRGFGVITRRSDDLNVTCKII